MIVDDAVFGKVFRRPADLPEKRPKPFSARFAPAALEAFYGTFRMFRIRFSDFSGNF
jgi:hypothetical protein